MCLLRALFNASITNISAEWILNDSTAAEKLYFCIENNININGGSDQLAGIYCALLTFVECSREIIPIFNGQVVLCDITSHKKNYYSVSVGNNNHYSLTIIQRRPNQILCSQLTSSFFLCEICETFWVIS